MTNASNNAEWTAIDTVMEDGRYEVPADRHMAEAYESSDKVTRATIIVLVILMVAFAAYGMFWMCSIGDCSDFMVGGKLTN